LTLNNKRTIIRAPLSDKSLHPELFILDPDPTSEIFLAKVLKVKNVVQYLKSSVILKINTVPSAYPSLASIIMKLVKEIGTKQYHLFLSFHGYNHTQEKKKQGSIFSKMMVISTGSYLYSNRHKQQTLIIFGTEV
jgi:hypothetical protein